MAVPHRATESRGVPGALTAVEARAAQLDRRLGRHRALHLVAAEALALQTARDLATERSTALQLAATARAALRRWAPELQSARAVWAAWLSQPVDVRPAGTVRTDDLLACAMRAVIGASGDRAEHDDMVVHALVALVGLGVEHAAQTA